MKEEGKKGKSKNGGDMPNPVDKKANGTNGKGSKKGEKNKQKVLQIGSYTKTPSELREELPSVFEGEDDKSIMEMLSDESFVMVVEQMLITIEKATVKKFASREKEIVKNELQKLQEIDETIEELKEQIEKIKEIRENLIKEIAVKAPHVAGELESKGIGTGRKTRKEVKERREKELEIIRNKPGIRLKDIAEAVGEDARNIFGDIRALEAAGKVKKQEGRVYAL